jgi:AcrR family transcriptional regulator
MTLTDRMVGTAGPVGRRDAVRNRARILQATRAVVAERGADVPLDAVIREAGVGKGTFYRHFSDRRALFAALYDDALELLTRIRDEAEPGDALVAVIRAAAPLQKEVFPFASALNRSAPADVLRAIDRRFAELLQEPLVTAKRNGTVRHDLTADEVALLLTMIGGASVFRPDADEPCRTQEALRIALETIRPRA